QVVAPTSARQAVGRATAEPWVGRARRRRLPADRRRIRRSPCPSRLERHGLGAAGAGGGAGAGGVSRGAGAPPPISVLRMPSDNPASPGDLPGSGTAASFFCQAWQPSVLNVLSVGSIFTVCGFLLMALSSGCLPSPPSRFQ